MPGYVSIKPYARTDRQTLLQLEEEIASRWAQLPATYQAATALTLLEASLRTDCKTWVWDFIELLRRGGEPYGRQS